MFSPRNIFITLFALSSLVEGFEYPNSEKSNQIDTYHGIQVADPYRWLEDLNLTQTQTWIKKQNRFTSEYLTKIPHRDKIENRLRELINYPRYSAPFKIGKYLLFAKNEGLQNQSIIYIQNELTGESKIFLDPNTFSSDGTTSIRLMNSSKNDKYIAFAISEAGSDWETIQIIEIETGNILEDKIERVKFSNAAWKDDGFYYCCYDQDNLFNVSESKKIYYHKLNTPQINDTFIFEDTRSSQYNFYIGADEEERFLFLYILEGCSGNEVYYKDLNNDSSGFQPLIKGFTYNFSVMRCIDDQFLVQTNYNAPNGRLLLIDSKNPSEESWKEILPEKSTPLICTSVIGRKIFASYLLDGINRVYQYDLNGVFEKEISSPTIGTISPFFGNFNDSYFYYSFDSFTYPSTIFKYDIKTGNSEIWQKATPPFDPNAYEIKQVSYASKDGTMIPMFIVHKKGIQKDISNMTLLYGYGGFQSCITPAYSASRMILLENNGVLAIPLLRGGGEYGKKWHDAGKLLNKQNVFDDFIGAAEYLIKERYTSKQKLGIHGKSNGGLLVGACMTQRPDLFKVCFPEVGVLDMLRYHLFTVGYLWTTEYGSSNDPEHFQNLYHYSPLHNVRHGVEYPATLITTGDHDNRVYPAHSFKFAAALQENNGENPILIRISSNTGHGAGKPISKYIEEQVDFWSFFFKQMNAEQESRELSYEYLWR